MKKSASLLAFVTVIVLFVLLYNIFIDSFANALSLIWVIMLLVFLGAYLVRRFVYVPRFQRALAQELGLENPEEEIKTNKELKKGAALRARRTFLGELSSYFWFFFIIFAFRAFIYEPFKIPSGSMQPTLQIGDYIAVNKHYYRLHDPIWQKTIVKLNPVERGDIVVFKAPNTNEDWIKRVLGLPGDVVHYDQYTQTFTILSSCSDPQTAARNLDWNNLANLPAGCNLVPISYGQFTPAREYFYHGNYQRQRTETLTNSQGTQVTHYTLQNPVAFNYVTAVGIYSQPGLPALTWVVPADHYFMIGDNRDNSQDSRFVGPISYQAIVGKAEFIWFALKYNNLGSLEGVNFSRIFTGLYPHIAPSN